MLETCGRAILFNSLICLERFKMVVLRPSSALISQEGDLLTLLFSFSTGLVSVLLPLSCFTYLIRQRIVRLSYGVIRFLFNDVRHFLDTKA